MISDFFFFFWNKVCSWFNSFWWSVLHHCFTPRLNRIDPRDDHTALGAAQTSQCIFTSCHTPEKSISSKHAKKSSSEKHPRTKPLGPCLLEIHSSGFCFLVGRFPGISCLWHFPIEGRIVPIYEISVPDLESPYPRSKTTPDYKFPFEPRKLWLWVLLEWLLVIGSKRRVARRTTSKQGRHLPALVFFPLC